MPRFFFTKPKCDNSLNKFMCTLSPVFSSSPFWPSYFLFSSTTKEVSFLLLIWHFWLFVWLWILCVQLFLLTPYQFLKTKKKSNIQIRRTSWLLYMVVCKQMLRFYPAIKDCVLFSLQKKEKKTKRKTSYTSCIATGAQVRLDDRRTSPPSEPWIKNQMDKMMSHTLFNLRYRTLWWC